MGSTDLCFSEPPRYLKPHSAFISFPNNNQRYIPIKQGNYEILKMFKMVKLIGYQSGDKDEKKQIYPQTSANNLGE